MLSRIAAAATTAAIALAMIGCGTDSAYDPNYDTKVELTDAEKARERDLMTGQQAPGAIDPGSGQVSSQPGTLTVPGKN
jgi:hypothetical protein